MSKTLAQLVAEANAAVTAIDATDAMATHASDEAVWIDLREAGELAASGRLPKAVHVPRGLLEFQADASSPMHKAEFSSGKPLILFCASGGRSALGAKTLQDMGFSNVKHLQGGFGAWQAAGGAVSRD